MMFHSLTLPLKTPSIAPKETPIYVAGTFGFTMDASPQQVQLQGGWVTADADAAMGETIIYMRLTTVNIC